MSEHPAEEKAEAISDGTYDCWACHWRPPGESFCGTCIQKILDAIQTEKAKKEMKNYG